MTSLFEKYPHLKDQWSDKNIDDPDSISYGSNKIAWRKPPCGHEYQQIIKSWSSSKCSMCAGKIVVAGVNDLNSKYPDIAKEWSDKNALGPDSVSPSSGKSVWWKCSKNHEWKAVIRNRKNGGCPYCGNQKAISGINDLATTHPELAKQWSDKNDLGPEFFMAGSKKKAWRKPPCGHEYMQVISNWKRHGCSVCSNIIIVSGINDLATTHQELAKQWSDKNDFSPDSVGYGSCKKAWRVHPCGHETEQAIKDWTIHGCPICSKNIIIPGVNDFKTTNPTLAQQWSKKNLFEAGAVGEGSVTKAWRIHPCGHETKQAVYRWKNRGCSKCVNHVSKKEQELFDFIKTLCPDAQQSNRTLISPKEIDIYIPSKKIAIEFNGLYWHSEQFRDKNYHYDKWLACKNQGVQLITIWEDQWNNNRLLVEKMLKAKLKINNEVVYGRKTSVKNISFKECSDFLNNWHIQGSCVGKFYIGLFKDQELIGVCVISKTGELRRYASSVSIIGGLDKCLKFSGLNEFYTFADHCVSAGVLYESTGWEFNKEIKPDYKYITESGLIHKFNYRIAKFKSSPNLIYIKGKSESELAIINELFRVYDCGKTRYTKNIL